MKGKFIPEIPGENVSYPGKKTPRPGPTRNKIPRPGPTRNKIPRPDPKIFFKMFPDPGPVSVRSGPGKLGISGRPAGLYCQPSPTSIVTTLPWFYG